MNARAAVCGRTGLLLVILLAGGCGRDVTAESAAFAQVPGSGEKDAVYGTDVVSLDQMSERELLVAVLDKLAGLETRMERELKTAYARLDSVLPQVSAAAGADNPPGRGFNPSDPQGVPQQLRLLREQVAVLNEKVNMLTVGIGLPPPPDSELGPSELFQTSSKVCLTLGTSLDTKLTGELGPMTFAKGGVGIDFYGNKLVVDLKGRAKITGEMTASPVKGGANYSFCVNAGREEAQAILAALPFSPTEFEARFNSLASQIGDLRAGPFSILDPNFRLFGMSDGGYPSRSAMLSNMDGFFNGIRGNICSRLRNRFDVVDDLNLGTGTLGGIISPAATSLQSRFNSDC